MQTYGTKKPGGICRLGINGRFPIIFYEDMFMDNGDYHALLKHLSWVEKKYSHQHKSGLKGAVAAYYEQLVTYSAGLLIVASSSILLFMSQDDFFSAIKNFAFSKNVIESHEYYRFVTAFFLHLNPVHLFVNILSLGILGGMLERYFGSFRYFNIIFFSTFSAWVFSLAFSPHNLVVGASGGISGLFGAFIALKFVSKDSLPPSVDPMPFWWVAIILILQVLLDLYSKSSDLSAHIGGLVGGAAFFILSRFAFKNSSALEKLVSLVLLLLCLFSFSISIP